ncbi:MAG: beta-galactosidase trimerization domain-containing protein, partial [Planctomycetota bacterium]
ADPETPCGIVGAQSPSPFGGYDYARLMRKVRFIEAYDLGGAHSIIRSFNPGNAMPVVTTLFHVFDPKHPQRADDDIWQLWYYLAHGNSGIIGWVDETWFDAGSGAPRAWHETMAPHCLEAGRTIGPLVRGAQWMHDGVAIYYSHASIQLGWILDAEAHGNTWWNRKGDHRIGASHCVRRAWEDMLRDEGLQYNFISYADVIQNGVDEQYRVLILPAVPCLSDVEAQRIRAFCKAGGMVIADYMPGLWDQHGRGRKKGGALDGLFHADHDPGLRSDQVFQERLWTEVDQEARYDYTTNEEFLGMDNTCVMHESGFHKAVRDMDTEYVNAFGKGSAVLMNLSPQMYNAYRERGAGEAKKRETFMKHLHHAGLERWVEVESERGEAFGYTITYWKRDDRIVLFLVFHPEMAEKPAGQGGIKGLKTAKIKIRLKFTSKISQVRNERTRETPPSSDFYEIEWKMNEAIVISFAAR